MILRNGIYHHFKGEYYTVLGVAMPIASNVPINLEFGKAMHSELMVPCDISILNNILVARFEPGERFPSIEALVWYVPRSAGNHGPTSWVRPLSKWNEPATLKTAYSERQVPRYTLVNG